MNITTQVNQLPLATVVNPPTDSLRRDNAQREVITAPPALNQSAAEKGVASERERARTPAQNVEEGIDFAAIQEQAERESTSIGERQSSREQPGEQQGQQEQGKTATRKLMMKAAVTIQIQTAASLHQNSNRLFVNLVLVTWKCVLMSRRTLQ